MSLQDVEVVPTGKTAGVESGDFILCHRKGLASNIIRLGERVRYPKGDYWSHAAYCLDSIHIVEALTKGVVLDTLDQYHNIPYIVVHTDLTELDKEQANAFALSCVGYEYGWSVIVGVGLRFLTPGKGLWFGMNGVEICSGLVAQTQVRGWKNYKQNPASITPTELAIEHGAKNAV